MFSRTNILSLACVTAALIPSLASAYEEQVEHNGMNLTLIHDSVKASDNALQKRSIPEECQFGDSHSDWTWIQITGLPDGETACFGYNDYPLCGDGNWDDPDWTDIQTAMGEQTTLDGQFKGSSAGDWKGSFFLGTTAFSNRDTSLFILGLVQAKAKAVWYYFSQDGDFAQVVGHGDNCP